MMGYLIDFDCATIIEFDISKVVDENRWKTYASFAEAKLRLENQLRRNFASAEAEYRDSLNKLLRFYKSDVNLALPSEDD